eukprot:3350083-Rhodomonas_salina.1
MGIRNSRRTTIFPRSEVAPSSTDDRVSILGLPRIPQESPNIGPLLWSVCLVPTVDKSLWATVWDRYFGLSVWYPPLISGVSEKTFE